MIGVGRFTTEREWAYSLLKTFGLVRFRNPRPADDADTVRRIRNARDYRGEYDQYQNAQAYDLVLTDGALLVFRYAQNEKTSLSYSYLECPYESTSSALDAEPTDSSLLWEQEQLPVGLRHNPISVRYDWSPSLYAEGRHPAGHLHVGYKREIRLAVDAILTPAQFVLMVLRQFYPTTWIKATDRKDVRDCASRISSTEVAEWTKGKDFLELRLVACHVRGPVAVFQSPMRAKAQKSKQ